MYFRRLNALSCRLIRLRAIYSFFYETRNQYSTIYGLSSGHGKCGIAVIRISGENARQSIFKMTSQSMLPPARKAVLRDIVNPVSGEILDKGLVLWFPQPNSFTGEDSVELHLHGSPAVLKSVLSTLGRLPGFTPAEPGDFTKRAFYNSKMDLTSVEGLGDLIHAETEVQRKQAFRQMQGSLSKVYSEWRECIMQCRANIEAYIDFGEDDNIEHGVLLDVRTKLESLILDISSHLNDSRRGERLKSGLNLAILGKPNVGKSSLLNAITQKPSAIVSPYAGTTRDVVSVSLDIGGYPVNISDTAGLRATEDCIEKEGIRRALGHVEDADIVLVVVDASEAIGLLSNIEKFDFFSFLSSFLRSVSILSSDTTSSVNKYSWLVHKKYLVLFNKIDLLEENVKRELLDLFSLYNNVCFTSLTTNEGVEEVLSRMTVFCDDLCGSNSVTETPYLTSQRQRTHLEECARHLKAVLGLEMDGLSEDHLDQPCRDLLEREETLVLAAQRFQMASNQLGHITGHITTEDVLDVIFSSFCIGK